MIVDVPVTEEDKDRKKSKNKDTRRKSNWGKGGAEDVVVNEEKEEEEEEEVEEPVFVSVGGGDDDVDEEADGLLTVGDDEGAAAGDVEMNGEVVEEERRRREGRSGTEEVKEMEEFGVPDDSRPTPNGDSSPSPGIRVEASKSAADRSALLSACRDSGSVGGDSSLHCPVCPSFSSPAPEFFLRHLASHFRKQILLHPWRRIAAECPKCPSTAAARKAGAAAHLFLDHGVMVGSALEAVRKKRKEGWVPGETASIAASSSSPRPESALRPKDKRPSLNSVTLVDRMAEVMSRCRRLASQEGDGRQSYRCGICHSFTVSSSSLTLMRHVGKHFADRILEEVLKGRIGITEDVLECPECPEEDSPAVETVSELAVHMFCAHGAMLEEASALMDAVQREEKKQKQNLPQQQRDKLVALKVMCISTPKMPSASSLRRYSWRCPLSGCQAAAADHERFSDLLLHLSLAHFRREIAARRAGGGGKPSPGGCSECGVEFGPPGEDDAEELAVAHLGAEHLDVLDLVIAGSQTQTEEDNTSSSISGIFEKSPMKRRCLEDGGKPSGDNPESGKRMKKSSEEEEEQTFVVTKIEINEGEEVYIYISEH